MSFQEFAKQVRAQAAQLGIRTPMNQLNHAIAIACYDKKYSAVIAAEKANKLSAFEFPPLHIEKAAYTYRIDAYRLGRALQIVLEGLPRGRGNACGEALDWLGERFESQLSEMFSRDFAGLVPSERFEYLMASPGFPETIELVFAEHVIAEGELLDEQGRSHRTIDLLLANDAIDESSRSREYITALAQTPLRLYRVERIIPGFRVDLRPMTSNEQVIHVKEAAGSHPALQGNVVGARILAIDGHWEMAGGIYLFETPFEINRVQQASRGLKEHREVARVIRQAWLSQSLEPTEFVQASTGNAMCLTTDTYQCSNLAAFGRTLSEADDVEDFGNGSWSLNRRCDDGRIRQMCGITLDKDAPQFIEVFYQTVEQANEYRPWFERVCGDSITFVNRETTKTGDKPRKNTRHNASSVPPDLLAAVASQFIHEHYIAWADMPLPILDGLSPRSMLKKPGGEERVRELISGCASMERAQASTMHRPPISFDFLYEALDLPRNKLEIEQPIFPLQFAALEAWVVCKLFDDPVRTTAGEMDMIVLMDVRSTMILNQIPVLAAEELSAESAITLLTQSRYAPELAGKMPRKLFISRSLIAGALAEEAEMRGIEVSYVSDNALLPVVGEAKRGIGAKLKARGLG